MSYYDLPSPVPHALGRRLLLSGHRGPRLQPIAAGGRRRVEGVCMAKITLRYPWGDRDAEVKRELELHGFRCALHRPLPPYDGWYVSEFSTGVKIAEGMTIKSAIAAARKVEKRNPLAEWRKAMRKAKRQIAGRKL